MSKIVVKLTIITLETILDTRLTYTDRQPLSNNDVKKLKHLCSLNKPVLIKATITNGTTTRTMISSLYTVFGETYAEIAFYHITGFAAKPQWFTFSDLFYYCLGV